MLCGTLQVRRLPRQDFVLGGRLREASIDDAALLAEDLAPHVLAPMRGDRRGEEHVHLGVAVEQIPAQYATNV